MADAYEIDKSTQDKETDGMVEYRVLEDIHLKKKSMST